MAEGVLAANTENKGGTNVPERQSATHQKKQRGVKGRKITWGMIYAGMRNMESIGMMACAQHVKMGINTDGDSGETLLADGDGISRGDDQKFGITDIKNRGENTIVRTDAGGGERQI